MVVDMVLTSLQCVRESSATYEGVRNVGMAVDHFGLNKFGSRNDNYRLVLSKVTEITSSLIKDKKRIYSVPPETTSTYVQRHELSKSLEDRLRVDHKKASISHAVTIVGLGGTGKSQLALKYAETHKERYDPILWIDATNTMTALSSFQRCAA